MLATIEVEESKQVVAMDCYAEALAILKMLADRNRDTPQNNCEKQIVYYPRLFHLLFKSFYHQQESTKFEIFRKFLPKEFNRWYEKDFKKKHFEKIDMLENEKIVLTSNLDDLKKKFNDSKMQIIFEKKKKK